MHDPLATQGLSVIRTGRANEPPARRALRAGPLTLLLEGGDLRYIRLGDREVLRRVYVAVRDANWGTIPAVYAHLQIEARDDSFDLTFEALHREGAVSFAWRGTVHGAPDGTITYAMDGEALETFARNRIGICVLHPMAAAGAPCRVEHADGVQERGSLPVAIAPHQPFLELRAIAHAVAPGIEAEVRFEGDIFEIEDQRNWIDASFKTYSTPLRLAFPVEVPRGTRIAQSLTLALRTPDRSGTGAYRPPDSRAARPGGAVQIAVDPTRTRSLPALGLGSASHGEPLSARELGWLRGLRLAHLRVDIDLDDPSHEAALRRAAVDAAALGVALEVALFVADPPAIGLDALARLIAELKPLVARWLVFRRDAPATDGEWVRAVRRTLAPLTPGAAFGGGTDAYFAQLNRNRPPIEALDLVAYSANPQVHAADDASLAETPPAIAATLASARAFCGDLPIIVSPLTLRPRANPDATGPEPPPPPGALPPQVDPRQASLLGAAWTVAALAYLAEGGAASATLFETTGWRGVMETDEGSALPDRFPSHPGMLFPVYHVLADVGERAGEETAVLRVISSDPIAVEGLALRRGDRTRLLLANLSAEPRRVLVRIDGTTIRTGAIRMLDERSFGRAAHEGEAFRGAAPLQLEPGADGALTLDLLPHAVATADLST